MKTVKVVKPIHRAILQDFFVIYEIEKKEDIEHFAKMLKKPLLDDGQRLLLFDGKVLLQHTYKGKQ